MRISDWSSDVCSSDLPAFDQIGGLRLVDIDARERVGGQILKIEIAAGGGKDLAPVDGGEDIRQPADADAGQFIVIVVRHLNARTRWSDDATVGSGNLLMSCATIESTT